MVRNSPWVSAKARQVTLNQEVDGEQHHQGDNHIINERDGGRQCAPILEMVRHYTVTIDRNQCQSESNRSERHARIRCLCLVVDSHSIASEVGLGSLTYGDWS